jgi:putative effector of murein hydrolase
VGSTLTIAERLGDKTTPCLSGVGQKAVAPPCHRNQMDETEGAVSGLVMAPAGVLNVLAAPLVAHAFR